MLTVPIRTSKVRAGKTTLATLLDKSLESISEGSVLAITSKIVSLCENRTVPIKDTDKAELVKQESEYYMPSRLSKYGYQLTITNNRLIAMAGIDESNGRGNYILWPHNPQGTANKIRQHLIKRFGLEKVGVIITDSTCTPLQYGTTGMALSHSGFKALNDYIGSPDLFGTPFAVSKANITGGLAASAVLAMGEGAEQTPIVLMTDLPFVAFQDDEPSAKELLALRVPREDDLFEPFLNSVQWSKGAKANQDH